MCVRAHVQFLFLCVPRMVKEEHNLIPHSFNAEKMKLV